jgi:hypothetical protein
MFMAGGRARAARPRDYAVDPDNWLESQLGGATGGDAVLREAASAVQVMARRLGAAIGDSPGCIGRNALAAASGVGRQTISDLIAGRTWPDVLTIYRLEHALDTTLWRGGGADRS